MNKRLAINTPTQPAFWATVSTLCHNIWESYINHNQRAYENFDLKDPGTWLHHIGY